MGHILALRGDTGEFIQFLNQAGWNADVKKTIRESVLHANMSRFTSQLIQNQLQYQKDANEMVKLTMSRLTQELGLQKQEVYHEQRDTYDALALA